MKIKKRKRNIYIALFVLLGFLTQFLLHAVIEIFYINKLLENFSFYGLGLSWNQWLGLHGVFTFVFLVVGLWVGYAQGIFWWNKIYEKKVGIH